eukprot:2108800-Prymnesium_polylepis.1
MQASRSARWATISSPTRRPTGAGRTTRCCAVLRVSVWHAATQTSATHGVVLGDKEHLELYTRCSTRSAWSTWQKTRIGDAGGDLENKAYFDLVPIGTSAATDTSLRGATDAFGNMEEKLIRSNFGVEARDGEGRFDPSTGKGA